MGVRAGAEGTRATSSVQRGAPQAWSKEQRALLRLGKLNVVIHVLQRPKSIPRHTLAPLQLCAYCSYGPRRSLQSPRVRLPVAHGAPSVRRRDSSSRMEGVDLCWAYALPCCVPRAEPSP